jgi:CRISPR-associated endonuclease Csn1
MKKVLGLDIGTNSIGWALTIEDDDNNADILDMGVRIVSSDSTSVNEFERGLTITKNEKRRKARGARRMNHRYKHRRLLLNQFLERENMMPDDNLIKNISALELYGLHDKGARGEQLTLVEIGRILLHLNQKRGYKSNRKANNDDEKDNNTSETESKDPTKMGYLEKIADRESQIKQEGVTIGQHFFQLLKNTEGSAYARLKQQIFTRASYIAEFEAIWNKQQAFYPNVLTDANKAIVRDEILYFQRPLKSQKHLVSDCRFEKGHKAAPRSSPIFQVFKVWQIVNNITITNVRLSNTEGYNYLGERNLTANERQLVFDYLQTVRNVKASVVLKKVLNLNPNIGFGLNYELLEGNVTLFKFLEAFEKQNYTNKELLLFNVNDRTNQSDKQPYMQLWHKIYSVEDATHLTKDLIETFGLPEPVAKALVKINLPTDYGSLSTRAIRRLLPFLQAGLTYDKACEAAAEKTGNRAYREHKATKDEKRETALQTSISQVLPTELRNPVVEQIVNQVINLVNKIIATPEYVTQKEREDGAFEIRIELARELKSNQKQRNNTTKNIAAGRKNNERIVMELEKIKVRPTSRNIEKYKLWEEQGKTSPYTFQPIEPIPLSRLFDENLYEIEHVIPRSRFFDDSMNNKVIAETVVNRDKGNMTGYEYMQSKGKLDAYTLWVNKTFWQREKRGKRERLLTSEIPNDFVARQLKETQYITKEVVSRLKEICYDVHVSSGAITEYLRDAWGLNDTLKTLNWSKYEAAGKTQQRTNPQGKVVKTIADWSKRDDHRHHAIDALIVAFTKQGMIQSLNTLNAQIEGHQTELKIKGRKFPAPMPHFVARAIEMTDKILISHRKRTKVVTNKTNRINKGKAIEQKQTTSVPRGALHLESVHGKIRQYDVVDLSPRFRDWDLISHPTIKALVMERLAEHNNDPSVAFKNYAKNPIFLDKAKTKPMLKVTIWREEFVIKYAVGTFKLKDLPYVLDNRVRKLLEERLTEHKDDPKKAFKDPLYYDAEKQLPILSVRCRTGKGNLLALHENEKGEPIDFVATGSNHHLAIYENEEGKKDSDIVSFWLAAQRKLNGDDILLTQHPEKGNLIQTFAINEMFVIGLNPKEVDFFDAKNAALLSKHLYRVQSASDFDIFFRHHLETKLESDADKVALARTLKKFYRFKSIKAYFESQPTKVLINNVGKIEKLLTI